MALSRLFKFDLDTCTRKPAGPPSLPAACLVAVGMPPNNELTISLSQHGFSVLACKSFLKVTNYTLVEAM